MPQGTGELSKSKNRGTTTRVFSLGAKQFDGKCTGSLRRLQYFPTQRHFVQAVRLNKGTTARRHSKKPHRCIEIDGPPVQRWQLGASEEGGCCEDAANGDRSQHQRGRDREGDSISAQRKAQSGAYSVRKKR